MSLRSNSLASSRQYSAVWDSLSDLHPWPRRARAAVRRRRLERLQGSFIPSNGGTSASVTKVDEDRPSFLENALGIGGLGLPLSGKLKF